MQQPYSVRRVALPAFSAFSCLCKRLASLSTQVNIPPDNKLVAFCLLLSIILIIVSKSAVEKFDQKPIAQHQEIILLLDNNKLIRIR